MIALLIVLVGFASVLGVGAGAIVCALSFNRKIDCLCEGLIGMPEVIYDLIDVREDDWVPFANILYPYFMVLEFSDGEVVSSDTFLRESVGFEDDMEILPEEDGQPGLIITYGACARTFHRLDGKVELDIPVEESFARFRDRLLSGGWQLESRPEHGDESDEASSCQTAGFGEGK